MKDQCRECMKRRDNCRRLAKLSGGNFRSGARRSHAMICRECVTECFKHISETIAKNLTVGTYVGAGRWEVDAIQSAYELYMDEDERAAQAAATPDKT
jgi:hypothetical protein